MSTSACEQTSTELVAFLDDELSVDARRPVAEHLASCLGCRREMERLSTVHGWLHDLPQVTPGPTFAADFARRLASEPTPIGSRRPGGRGMWWALPTLAAAAALALALRSFVDAPAPQSPASDHTTKRAAIARSGSPAQDEEPARVATRPPAEKAAAGTQVADVDALRPEDLPPELLEHPELFLRLPVVKRLDTLEYLGSLHEQRSTDDGGAG